jgi:hypothetical protein
MLLKILLISSFVYANDCQNIADPLVKSIVEKAVNLRKSHPYQELTFCDMPQSYEKITSTLILSQLPHKFCNVFTNKETLTPDQATVIYNYFRDENYPNMILQTQQTFDVIIDNSRKKPWSYWCSIL